MFGYESLSQFEGVTNIDHFIYKTRRGTLTKIESLETLKLFMLAGGKFLPIYK